MKKIVMACFWNQESNCGDKSYIEVFRALIRRYSSEATVDLCDFYARREFVAPNSEKSSKPTLKKRIASLLPHWVYKWIHNRNKYRRIRKYYEMKLKDADALVVPGGGLVEYSSWRDYYYLMQMLEKYVRREISQFSSILLGMWKMKIQWSGLKDGGGFSIILASSILHVVTIFLSF